MGDPKKTKKHFERPLRLWDKENLERERAMKETYGLKNKRELWRIKTMLSKKRKSARQLLARPLEERLKREQALLNSLAKLGVLDEKAVLDDILTLSIDAMLERRLQTMVMRKGLANTAKQARQFITHGHIAIGGKKVNAPGYLVTREEEGKLSYYGKKMELKPKEPVKKAKPAAKKAAVPEKGAEEKVRARKGEAGKEEATAEEAAGAEQDEGKKGGEADEKGKGEKEGEKRWARRE